jgi:hypothetical protein
MLHGIAYSYSLSHRTTLNFNPYKSDDRQNSQPMDNAKVPNASKEKSRKETKPKKALHELRTQGFPRWTTGDTSPTTAWQFGSLASSSRVQRETHLIFRFLASRDDLIHY